MSEDRVMCLKHGLSCLRCGVDAENEIVTLRESLRVKTKELAEAKEGIVSLDATKRHLLNEFAMAQAALASSKAHHQYDNQRKDSAMVIDVCDGLCQRVTDDGWDDCGRCVIRKALVPSTPAEAEAWAREQKEKNP